MTTYYYWGFKVFRFSVYFLILSMTHLYAQDDLTPDIKEKDFHIADPEDAYFNNVESDSSMYNAYLQRATHRMDSRYYKGALEDYNLALKIKESDPAVWFTCGTLREKFRDLKGALAAYTKAIEINPNYLEAHMSRGRILLKTLKYAEASDDFSFIISSDTTNANAYYYRALTKQSLKQADACSDLKKAETLGRTISKDERSKICTR